MYISIYKVYVHKDYFLSLSLVHRVKFALSLQEFQFAFLDQFSDVCQLFQNRPFLQEILLFKQKRYQSLGLHLVFLSCGGYVVFHSRHSLFSAHVVLLRGCSHLIEACYNVDPPWFPTTAQYYTKPCFTFSAVAGLEGKKYSMGLLLVGSFFRYYSPLKTCIFINRGTGLLSCRSIRQKKWILLAGGKLFKNLPSSSPVGIWSFQNMLNFFLKYTADCTPEVILYWR